jgi:hypothetical protein
VNVSPFVHPSTSRSRITPDHNVTSRSRIAPYHNVAPQGILSEKKELNAKLKELDAVRKNEKAMSQKVSKAEAKVGDTHTHTYADCRLFLDALLFTVLDFLCSTTVHNL